MAHSVWTIHSDGVSGDYSSYAAAWSAKLTDSNVPWFKGMAGGGDLGGGTFSGATTFTATATEPVRWYVASGAGHDGTEASGGAYATTGFSFLTDHVYIGRWDDATNNDGEEGEGFRITRDPTGACLVFDSAHTYKNLTVDSMLLEAGQSDDGVRVTVSAPASTAVSGIAVKVRRCGMHAADGTTQYNYGFRFIASASTAGSSVAGDIQCYNNTSAQCRNNCFRFQGSHHPGGSLSITLAVKNCIGFQHTGGTGNQRFYVQQTTVGNFSITASNNCADDTSPTDTISTAGGLGGSSSQVSAVDADVLEDVTIDSVDLNPKTTGVAYGNGVAVSGIDQDALGNAIISGYIDIGFINLSQPPASSVSPFAMQLV